MARSLSCVLRLPSCAPHPRAHLVDGRALLALRLEAAVDDGVQPADERRERLPLGAGQAGVEAAEEAVRLVELLLEEVEQ
eukprot:3035193-Prymnesium_polylepis.1